MIKIWKNNNQKKRIKTNKLLGDNRSISSVSVFGESITTVSPGGDRILRKKKQRDSQKFQSQGIK